MADEIDLSRGRPRAASRAAPPAATRAAPRAARGGGAFDGSSRRTCSPCSVARRFCSDVIVSTCASHDAVASAVLSGARRPRRARRRAAHQAPRWRALQATGRRTRPAQEAATAARPAPPPGGGRPRRCPASATVNARQRCAGRNCSCGEIRRRPRRSPAAAGRTSSAKNVFVGSGAGRWQFASGWRLRRMSCCAGGFGAR